MISHYKNKNRGGAQKRPLWEKRKNELEPADEVLGQCPCVCSCAGRDLSGRKQQTLND